MNAAGLIQLAIMTITHPGQAARQLLQVRPGKEALWLAFCLAVVLNVLVQTGVQALIPAPPGTVVEPQSVAADLAWSAGAMMFSTVVFLLVGRFLGGVASFEDLLLLTVWLQFLQVAAMFVALLISLVLPFLMAMFLLATAIISLYVTLHFLNEAHKFGSLLKSFGVIILTALVAVPLVIALTPNVPV